MTEATRQLAHFVVESRWDDIPAAIRHDGERALLNWLGCAIAGSGDAVVKTALAALRIVSGPAQATLLGRGERTDILNAAFLNSIASNALDFDDTHFPTLIHPTIVVAPAALAVAEHAALSGERFLHAFILGADVACRVGNAVPADHHSQGWEITSTCGVFGAAAACGKLLDLDEQHMSWALGIAAAQASGLTVGLGTMTKCFNMGRAAHAGLTAALLAQSGFTSTDRGLEGARGFLHVLARGGDADALMQGLGTQWALSRVAYKPYPCGIVIHPIIDACLELRAEHTLVPESIETVEVAAEPLVAQVTGNATPANGLDARPSTPHCVAAALVQGEVGVRQFTDACVRDPAVAALRARVRLRADADAPHGSATVTITLKDGRRVSKHVAHARGSLERPLTDDELDAKFRTLTAEHLAPDAATALIAQCRSVTELPDVAALARRGNR